MEQLEPNSTLEDIFFQNNQQRLASLRRNKTRFVYYTSAENAFEIIKSEKIWMRKILTMNDLSEFEHGRVCVEGAMNSDAGNEMQRILDGLFLTYPVCKVAYDAFRSWSNHIKVNTCIACFSEHHDSEDETGRLSMWRAYGGKNGVALIFNSEPFLDLYSTNSITTSAVEYLDAKAIAGRVQSIVTSIKDNIAFLSRQHCDAVYGNLYNLFKFASLCNKHPSFSEEREWRLILSVGENPASPKVPLEPEVINGVPQLVHKLKLTNRLELNNLLDRVLIGPCEFPYNTAEAFAHLLNSKKVLNSSNMVVVSKIPLRYQR